MPIKVRKFNAQVRDPESGQMIPAGLLSSDALEAINEAKQDAIDAVEAAGVQVEQSLPLDWTELNNEIDGLSENEYNYEENPFFYIDFKNERYNTGSGERYPSNNRLLNSKKTTLKYNAFMSCNDPALRFLLYYFNSSGTYIGHSGWVSKLFVEKGKIFTVEVKRNSETVDDLPTSNAKSIIINILDKNYLSPKIFNAVENGVCNIENFQVMIEYAKQYKYNIKLDEDFDFNFITNSTVQSPTRLLINGANGLTIDGNGHTVTMKGLTLAYLESIDDYNNGGRDIFTLFSFTLCDRCCIKNINIKGQYVYNVDTSLRYDSPRQKGIAFVGSSNCHAEKCVIDGMFGNAICLTPSSSDFQGVWTESSNCTITKCTASNCIENCFDSFGGVTASIYDEVYCYDSRQGIETAGFNQNVPKHCTTIANSFFKNLRYALVLNGRVMVSNCTITDSGTICGESFCGVVANTMFVTHRSIRVYPGSNPEFIGCRFYKSNLSWASDNPRAIDAVGTQAKPINVKIRGCTFDLSTILNLYFSYASVDISDSNFIGGTEITIYSYLPTGDVKITNSTYTQLYGDWVVNNNLESTSNKTTNIDSFSTDIKYPTAKAVYDFTTTQIGDITGNIQIKFSDPALKQYINTAQPTGTVITWDNPSTSSTTNIKWAVINCLPGEKFTLNGKGGYSDRLWAFLNNNKELLINSNTVATASNLILTAPENSAYLIINDEEDKISYIGELVIKKINDSKNDLIALENKVYSLNSEDEIVFSTTAGATQYFQYNVKNGGWYKFVNNSNMPIGLYTSNTSGGEIVETISASLNSENEVYYRASANANYLRIVMNASGSVSCYDLMSIIPKLDEYTKLSPYHKMKYIYDAKALGGKTDDDVAIQNYVDNENYVYIPAGTYRLHNPIEITRLGTTIEGESQGWRTKLMPYNDTVTSLIYAHRQSVNESLMLTLKNLAFITTNTDGTSNSGSAISSGNSVIIDSKIENCWFNGGNSNLNPLKSKAISGQLVQTMILGCWFEMFDVCIETKNTEGNSNGNTIANCSFWHNTNALYLAGQNNIRSCDFSSIKGGYIVKTDTNSNIQFSDNYIALSAPKNAFPDVKFPTASGIMFIVDNINAKLNINNISINGVNDGKTFYNYLLDASLGKVTIKNIDTFNSCHLEDADNTNGFVNLCYNMLENISNIVNENGSQIEIANLIPNCYMIITAENNTTITVTGVLADQEYSVQLESGETIRTMQFEGQNIITSTNGSITVKAFSK